MLPKPRGKKAQNIAGAMAAAGENVNSLLERIVSPENLIQAYKRVVRNKGAGGAGGMKVDELLQYLKDNGGEI